jgi:hypothetical protein
MARLVPAIHVFSLIKIKRRGCPAQGPGMTEKEERSDGRVIFLDFAPICDSLIAFGSERMMEVPQHALPVIASEAKQSISRRARRWMDRFVAALLAMTVKL